MFNIFKRKNKEDTQMTVDEKEKLKAEEDIKAKDEKSEQSEKDRVDESVAAQEKADGDENSQTAKDRIDESDGAKAADEGNTPSKEQGEKEKPDKLDIVIELLTELISKFDGGEKDDETPPEEKHVDVKEIADEDEEDDYEDDRFFKD